MSEIFNWLKRAELDRRKAITGSAVPDELEREEAEIEAPVLFGKPTPVPDNEPAPPIDLNFREGPTLDLSQAEYHVRSVLDPASLVGEQFRLLRARLSLLQKQKGTKTLLVTSATPGEGKTFVSCSLAGVLAQEQDKRILLIDGDLRRPKVGVSLGMADRESPGLCDILRDGNPVENVLVGCAGTGLYVLPAGSIPQSPSELLSSPKFETLLQSLAPLFDWIVVDSPPVISLADTDIIAPLCDTVLLVVRAGLTPVNLVKETTERIGKEKICGVVMNRIQRLKTSRYYYAYYQKK